ncbi:type IV toxin-antitoxin system AbiEi family antitoxin domain-containing protein [Halobacteriovorax sp. JY17]|uniref:type IV toxin-antitoxin system AbiEi family antitoxin domain-containing protein n=1 Tax=Halobacteriovorax sp. JY17 TaxID=2014617 RepID=UPI000C55AB17|nr:type IV toxin-antitoxin system AbiEi family antitoxin domain-containing protein [Halobacteriovorax sp. JY17]PIK14385.1 MAG: hypothetical protein CES88_08565 [Halobacteriovorax sp. JY17]
MNNNTQFQKLKPLLKKTVFRASEARELGISPSLINYYIKKGMIERVDRGVYRSSNQDLDVDFRYEDLVLVSKSIPDGVICLISALTLYELTDEIPRAHWIAVSHSSRAPRRSGARIVRMRNIDLGKTELTLGSEKVQIFDVERTILDSFRYLGVEIGVKALKAALARSGKDKLDLKKLQKYAKELRVKIAPYIMAVTT